MDTLRHVGDLAVEILPALDTPRSLMVHLLLVSGEYDQVAHLRFDPASYEPFFHHSGWRIRADYMATELVRKSQDLPLKVDRKLVAEQGFLDSEKRCCLTNLYLDRFVANPVLETEADKWVDTALRRARGWIAAVLGPLPDYIDGRFGPGATFESGSWYPGVPMTAYKKLAFRPTRTSGFCPGLYQHFVTDTILGRCWGARPDHIEIVRGNRFTTVPKDAAKDRGIAIEPGCNVFAQLGVMDVVRPRLKRVGLDLERNQPLHQRLAQEGSADGHLATIDLSSASDTISRKLVSLLLPGDWYQLLSSLRSPVTAFHGRWHVLEKFSSMGNGATFDLETLIFAAIVHACGGQIGRDSFVYGDDIITPTDLAPLVLATLRMLGFVPNERKTFVSGYFRESCGGEYYRGSDITPVHLLQLPTSVPEWISLINQLSSWDEDVLGPICERLVRRYVPKQYRCYGPRALGDIVLHHRAAGSHQYRIISGIRYLRVIKLIPQPKAHLERRLGADAPLVAMLMGFPSDGLSPRGNVAGFKLGWTPFS